MSTTVSDVELGALLDGELDPARRAEVEQALAADPKLAQRLAALSGLQGDLHALFTPVLVEPVPDRLTSLLAALPTRRVGADPAPPPATATNAAVLPFGPRASTPPRKHSWAQLAAAASVAILVGAAAGWTLFPQLSPGSSAGDGLLAGLDPASIQTVLEEVRSGDTRTVARHEIMPAQTFARQDGAWCREFRVSDADEAADAVACRQAGQWRVVAFATAPVAPATEAGPGSDSYVPATGPEGSAGIDALVEGLIDGGPLDPAEESRILAAGWPSR